jgi:hypothetical protein
LQDTPGRDIKILATVAELAIREIGVAFLDPNHAVVFFSHADNGAEAEKNQD